MPRTTAPKGEGKRYPLNMRTTKETRDKLAAAASESGRSLAQEVEFRINRSFVDDEMFSSHAVRLWAILMADEFHKAGIQAARYEDVPADDRSWMQNTRCFTQATFAVMDRMLQNAERQPGADVGFMNMWMEQMVARYQHRTGQLKFFDKDGNEMKSGFVERKPTNAR